MEEVSYIPGYKNTDVQSLYRPQCDYTYVNGIKAKKFTYNPNYKREPDGPFIQEYYERYETNTPFKKSIFTPVDISSEKLNRQCNPYVAYPYGVPQGPLYEKCHKCKGDKKFNKKKKNKKSNKCVENNFFSCKLKTCNSSNDIYSDKDQDFNENEDLHYLNYSQEPSYQSHNIDSNKIVYSNNLENEYYNEFETKKKSSNPIETFDVDNFNIIHNSIPNHLNLVDDENCEYYYSYNEKVNLNSQEKVKDYTEKYYSNNDNIHLNNDNYDNINLKNDYYDEIYEHKVSSEKSENDFKSYNIYNEDNQSTLNSEKDNEIGMTIDKNNYITYQNGINNIAYNGNVVDEYTKKGLPTKDKNIKYDVKNQKNEKQSKKQVEIRENKNIITKYNIMGDFKKCENVKENIKAKTHLHKNPNNTQESEKKKNEQHGRFCKVHQKYESEKKSIERRKKKENGNSIELLATVDKEFSPPSSHRSYEKYRKISLEKHNLQQKKKNEKEMKTKNSKAIIRVKSMKVRASNLTKKYSNLPLRKKSNLNNGNPMHENKLKKQNTLGLKKKKSMLRGTSIKPANKLFLSKKKVENDKKGLNIVDNKKKNFFQANSRKMMSRSKTKVYVNNESKVFKKYDAKMVLKNSFNPLVSKKSLKINELNSDKKKITKQIPKAKLETNLQLNTNTPKINTTFVRNKLKSKKKELYENIISLTKNMKVNTLRKKCNDKIIDETRLSISSNNSNSDHEYA